MSLEDLTLPQLLERTKKLESDNALFNKALNDPTTRTEQLALLKKSNPTLPIPELDVKAASDAALAAERGAREKLEKDVRDLQIQGRIDAERKRVMKEHGLSESDLLEVEKLMVDEKAPIPHYDAAAKVFKASRTQAEPSSSLISRQYEMPSKDVWGKGVGNKIELNKIAERMAYDAVNDLRRRGTA
jgi:hypothetical protein